MPTKTNSDFLFVSIIADYVIKGTVKNIVWCLEIHIYHRKYVNKA